MRKTNFVSAINGFMTGSILKISIFIFLLVFLSLGAMANPKMVTQQQIGMFKNSTTCVVLEDGINYYNTYIKDAIQKYWKSTAYEFITQQEFENRRSDSKYSFIVLLDNVYDKDPGGISYNCINLLLGQPSTNLTDMPELCSIPLSYSGDNDTDYEYAIPAIVKFMQIHAKNLEKERLLILLNGLKYYNNSKAFKDKVLLLNKEGMALYVDTPERIKTVYPYYVKLLSASEIQQELSTNPANALFLFHVGPTANSGSGKCFEMIFDAEGNLYYYNSRKITNDNNDGFNLDDFKNIS
jgi:hypothetical protein